jgi:PAS domain S-box-containing protein
MSDVSEKSPLRVLLVAVVLTLAGLLWVMWSIYLANFQDSPSQKSWMHNIVELEGEIRHLDEVMTMSARMSAESGDLKWERRYREIEPKLTQAIEQTIELVPYLKKTQSVEQIKTANKILVKMENRAFNLIQQGKTAQAKLLLFSPQYESQKQIYATGIGRLHLALHDSLEEAGIRRTRTNRVQISVVLAIILLMGVGWIIAYRVLGKWRTDVNREVRLREQLLETTQEGYWQIDPRGITIDINRAMCRILDRPREEIIGESVYKFVDDANAGIFKSKIADRRQGKLGAYEVQLQRRDGSNIHCLNNPTPLSDDSGVYLGSVGMFSDISNLKEVTKKLAHSAIEAQKANKVKSDLMANMSHELRTPLNAILGFSDTMRQEVFGPLGNDKYKEYLNDIYGSGEHLLDLINDILDVSAIEANALELQENDANLSDIFDSSMRLIQSRAHIGKVTLTSFIDPKVPLIFVDQRRMKQILLNLLSNAVKFTPEHGQISLSACLNDDFSLAISVNDTGMGMSEKEVETALSTFGQVDSGLDRKHEGTGLGLPLTKKLVELHDGSMDIYSKRRQGTSITVTLPKERVSGNVAVWSKVAQNLGH